MLKECLKFSSIPKEKKKHSDLFVSTQIQLWIWMNSIIVKWKIKKLKLKVIVYLKHAGTIQWAPIVVAIICWEWAIVRSIPWIVQWIAGITFISIDFEFIIIGLRVNFKVWILCISAKRIAQKQYFKRYQKQNKTKRNKLFYVELSQVERRHTVYCPRNLQVRFAASNPHCWWAYKCFRFPAKTLCPDRRNRFCSRTNHDWNFHVVHQSHHAVVLPIKWPIHKITLVSITVFKIKCIFCGL